MERVWSIEEEINQNLLSWSLFGLYFRFHWVFALLESLGLLVYVPVSTIPSHLNPGWTHRVKIGKHGSLRPSQRQTSAAVPWSSACLWPF